MDTIAYRAPRLSRAKALIGALLAALAVAGAVQAAAPGLASARPYHECSIYADVAWYWHNMGNKGLEEIYYGKYGMCLLEEVP